MSHMQALATLPAVAQRLRALLADLPPSSRPCPWWTAEVDMALLAALHRQGITDLELIRRHPGMVQAAWQQVGCGCWWWSAVVVLVA
jgi:hypothetical protein